ncbi:hypothetical protein ACW2Q0_00595 [Nocardia sp. R16R-3T]
MSILDQALADMRAGRRVLLIAPSAVAVTRLVDKALPLLRAGESARQRPATITGDRGWIQLRPYPTSRDSGRGLTLDRIYFDHSELYELLAPALSFATNGDRIVHGPTT